MLKLRPLVQELSPPTTWPEMLGLTRVPLSFEGLEPTRLLVTKYYRCMCPKFLHTSSTACTIYLSCVYLRHATPSRAGSGCSLDVMDGTATVFPKVPKIEEPFVKEPAEKKSRPSQHVPQVPAARKSSAPVKGDFSTGEGGKASAPLPKSLPVPPPKVAVQAKSPSSVMPSPTAKPIPAPSVPPKAAGPIKRQIFGEVGGDGPNKKATPPKTPSPSKAGAPTPTAAQNINTELLAKPVGTPSLVESKVPESHVGVSPSQAPTVPGDVPAPETQLDSQQSSQGQKGDVGCDGSQVESKDIASKNDEPTAATQAPPVNTATTASAPKEVQPPCPKVKATPPAPKDAPKAVQPPRPNVKATPPAPKEPPAPKSSPNTTPSPKSSATTSTPSRTPTSPSEFQVAPGATPIEPTDYKDRQAHYACFKRQVAKQDQCIPAEFIQAWNDAVKSNSRTAKNALFSKWCQAGGSWGSIFGSILHECFTYIYISCTYRCIFCVTKLQTSDRVIYLYFGNANPPIDI